MEGDKSASTFINSIVKNIQMLCHGQVNFSDNVEVIGHLYLNIDSNTKMNYIVNEKCSKFNSNTTFTSNSFHAEPNNVIKLNINANKNRSISRPRKHKAAPIEQEILAKIPKFVEEKFEVSEPERDAENVSLNLSYSIETETGNIETGELVESKFEPSFSISETDGASESLAASISNVDEESDNEIISPIDEIQMSSASLITPQFDEYVPELSFQNKERLLRSFDDELMPERDIEYTIVENGTKKAKPMLVDSLGYSYTLRKKTPTCDRWWCSKRNKKGRCPAAVVHRGEQFQRGAIDHDHEAQPGLLLATLIRAEARSQVLNDSVTPPSEVVERAMSITANSEQDLNDPTLPTQGALRRMINYYRKHNKVQVELQDESEKNDSQMTYEFI